MKMKHWFINLIITHYSESFPLDRRVEACFYRNYDTHGSEEYISRSCDLAQIASWEKRLLQLPSVEVEEHVNPYDPEIGYKIITVSRIEWV